MITDLRQDVIALFAYDRWANERIVAALRTVTDASIQQPMVRFLAHLARAQEVWLERVQQHRPSSDPIWPDDTFEEACERLQSAQAGWDVYLMEAAEASYDEPIAYYNSKGDAFSSTPRQVMTHVVNHGTHHRAQIALLLRQHGVAPPPTDYIFYVRER